MLSLIKKINKYDIILASKSPRRIELLKMIGLKFKVYPSNIEEKYQHQLTPVEYVLKNAREKNEPAALQYPTSLIISADTIVVLKNEILEKPHDKNHAYEILKKLNGNTHEVITGFGISTNSFANTIFDYQVTKVTFRYLSNHEIRAYCNTDEPLDKAGGYGAQGFGSMLIEKVDGCFYNVVGFPLVKFYITLRKFLESL